jgi:hypothetical protein
MVVARRLKAKVEPIFHQDSYGYRAGRSALDAVAAGDPIATQSAGSRWSAPLDG